MPATPTPTTVLARVLRDLGLKQGPGKDFRVTGHYSKGERTHTLALLLSPTADRTVAEAADHIERATAQAGYPFYVRVSRPDNASMYCTVANTSTLKDPQPEAAPALLEPTHDAVTDSAHLLRSLRGTHDDSAHQDILRALAEGDAPRAATETRRVTDLWASRFSGERVWGRQAASYLLQFRVNMAVDATARRRWREALDASTPF